MLMIYGLKNCSTCNKAQAWLTEQGIDFEFTDYRAKPLAATALQAYAKQLGWPKLVNRASMTWRKLPDAAKDPRSDSDWLQLVADNPTLIRRPLAVNGAQVRAGFKPAEWTGWLAD